MDTIRRNQGELALVSAVVTLGVIHSNILPVAVMDMVSVTPTGMAFPMRGTLRNI